MSEHHKKRHKLVKSHPHWKTGKPCSCGFVTHLMDVPEKPSGDPPAADPVTPDVGTNFSKTHPEDRWNF